MVPTRRDFLAGSAAALVGATVGRSWPLVAAQAGRGQQAPVTPVFTAIRNNVGFFTGHGGTIGYLINNAGLGTSKLLVDMSDEEWHKVIDVTLNGTMRMTRYMMQVMKQRGRGGVIVNNASVLGWRAQKEQCHYAAAKAGVMALTRCAALEAAEFNVRINAVSPSIVLHPMLRKSASEELLQELESKEAKGAGPATETAARRSADACGRASG